MAYDELYHWGIKGQKWGVRRYRNEDGSLTEAGKKRYSPGKKVAEKAGDAYKEHKRSISRYLEATKPSVIERMSDKDLDERIERLNKEDRYRELSYKRLSNGEKFAHDVLTKSGKIIATAGVIAIGKKIVDKIIPGSGEFVKLPKK